MGWEEAADMQRQADQTAQVLGQAAQTRDARLPGADVPIDVQLEFLHSGMGSPQGLAIFGEPGYYRPLRDPNDDVKDIMEFDGKISVENVPKLIELARAVLEPMTLARDQLNDALCDLEEFVERLEGTDQNEGNEDDDATDGDAPADNA